VVSSSPRAAVLTAAGGRAGSTGADMILSPQDRPHSKSRWWRRGGGPAAWAGMGRRFFLHFSFFPC